MLPRLLLSAFITTLVSAQEISGVFTSFKSLEYEAGANYANPKAPSNPSWVATLGWNLDGDTAKAGDTFTLNMPCVFKFTTTATEIDLKVDETSYASCSFIAGEILTDYSELKCVILPTVKKSVTYNGEISFPLTFNSGGSDNPVDLKCAKLQSSGLDDVKQEVTWSDGSNELSVTADFRGGKLTTDDASEIAFRNRVIPSLNKQQHYLLGGDCPNGYKSGSLGFTINTGADCSSAGKGITDALNAWYMPFSSSDGTFTTSCSGNEYRVDYENVPAGSRPFISILSAPLNEGDNVHVTYLNTYTCADSNRKQDNGRSLNWGTYQNADIDSNGGLLEVIVTTSTYPGTSTQITTLPFSSTGTKTIVVQVPSSIPSTDYTTVTSTWTGTNTRTTTLPYSSGDTVTVEIEVPEPTTAITTTTTTWTESTTRTTTLPYTSGDTITVEIDVPEPTSAPVAETSVTSYWTTLTSTWTESTTRTTTLPYTSGGNVTVEVDVPEPTIPITTITTTWTGTNTETTTLPYTSGETATVAIQVPSSPVPITTVTSTWTDTTTRTITLPYTSGETITVEIDVPKPTTPITTVTDVETTVITITSCSDDKCHTVPVTTGVTTATEVHTTYTTYCPLPSESEHAPSTTTNLETTVITITSCDNDKCHTFPVTTVVTVITSPETTTPGPETVTVVTTPEGGAPETVVTVVPSPETTIEGEATTPEGPAPVETGTTDVPVPETTPEGPATAPVPAETIVPIVTGESPEDTTVVTIATITTGADTSIANPVVTPTATAPTVQTVSEGGAGTIRTSLSMIFALFFMHILY